MILRGLCLKIRIIEAETVCEIDKDAVTHFKVIDSTYHKTHVALELETGRTHQIRVHMAHIGHPLLGDSLYGGRRDEMKRQALHSKSLTFYHPILEKEMSFTIKLQAICKSVVAYLKREQNSYIIKILFPFLME